ncbi:MAG: hypothetical protein IPL65_15720 [Lewinellaceae bacterium]|nr:hypothetical protein [Lewinellaceae bacterium]
MEDALRTTPRYMKDGKSCIGRFTLADHQNVMIPYAGFRVTKLLFWGLGAFIGETMAVLMVTGNSAIIPILFVAASPDYSRNHCRRTWRGAFRRLHFKALLL